jgi:hypothetical protein
MRQLSKSLLTLAASLVLTSPLLAQNDDCAGAIAIGDGLTIGTNTGSTDSAVTGSCGLMGSDVWYAYTASCTGNVSASLCINGGTADYDSVLSVFDGVCGTLTQIGCVDDGCGATNRQSTVNFPAVSGQTYLVAVGGYSGAQGNFTLAMACGLTSNDECAGATPITDGVTSGSNVGYTTSPQTATCSASTGSIGADMWYEYVAAGSGDLLVSVCTSVGGMATFDTILGAFSGTCGSLTEIACNDDRCGLQSQIRFPVTSGQTYYIVIGGYNGATGSYDLVVDCANCAAASSEIPRLGTPPNPQAFMPGVTSGPVIGFTWDPVVDHTTFSTGAIIDFMILSPFPFNSDLGPPVGTLLCDPLASFFMYKITAPGVPFAFPIPPEPTIVGVSLCTQGGSIDANFEANLANALDITIGVM